MPKLLFPDVVPNLTTTQRNAMTPEQGMIVFNTTTMHYEGYIGSTWRSIHDATSILDAWVLAGWALDPTAFSIPGAGGTLVDGNIPRWVDTGSGGGAFATYESAGMDAWLTFTPTVSQGTSTNISKTVNYSKYCKVGKAVLGECRLAITGAGQGTADIRVTAPVAEATSQTLNVGVGVVNLAAAAGATKLKCQAILVGGAGYFVFRRTDDATTGTNVGAAPAGNLASGDLISFSFFYEAT